MCITLLLFRQVGAPSPSLSPTPPASFLEPSTLFLPLLLHCLSLQLIPYTAPAKLYEFLFIYFVFFVAFLSPCVLAWACFLLDHLYFGACHGFLLLISFTSWLVSRMREMEALEKKGHRSLAKPVKPPYNTPSRHKRSKRLETLPFSQVDWCW